MSTPSIFHVRAFRQGSRGITLVELLAVVAISAIIASLAIPSYSNAVARAQVKRAAENIYGLVLQARTEITIRDTKLYVSVQPDPWCAGLSDFSSCDCTVTTGPDACILDVAGHSVVHRVLGSEFPQVEVNENFSGSGPSFNPIRRNAAAGTITISARNQVLEIKVSPNGRTRLCTPPDTPIAGYRPC